MNNFFNDCMKSTEKDISVICVQEKKSEHGKTKMLNLTLHIFSHE